MGWSHPDISLEDLLTLIKGFVDMLILASGYQSSGRFAHWDSQNIKNVFQWAIFFENVIGHLSCLDDEQESIKELDAAILNIKSNPHFPQGLAQLSASSLSSARKLVLEHLIRALPLRDAHLGALMTAIIEVDLDELQRTENDPFNVYLDKLMLQRTPLDPVSDGRSSVQTRTSFSAIEPSQVANHGIDDITTMLSIQELTRRQLAVSCILSVDTGLNILSNTINASNWSGLSNITVSKNLKPPAELVVVEELVDSLTWNSWIRRNLSYLLNKRTLRMVSGASLVFSPPKIQWMQVLDRMDISAEASDNDFRDTIELLLLGCIASRWSTLIEHFMSISYDSLSVTTMFKEVRNSLLGTSQNFNFNKGTIHSKAKDILEYLEVLLSSKLHWLWKLSPILAAISIPSWSQLFKLYISELESLLKGESSTFRCCKDGKKHRDCEVAERIWCLYIFHVRGSHIINGTTNT